MKFTKIILVSLLGVGLSGCKKTNEEILTGKWQAVSQENPELDMLIQQQRTFIDTVGNGTSREQNTELYQTNNIDSLKASLSTQVNAFVTEQKKFLENTSFYFREDHIAILNFAGNIDSTKWYFSDTSRLLLDEKALKGQGQVIEMDVLELKESKLKLRFNVKNFNSIVTFKPVKK